MTTVSCDSDIELLNLILQKIVLDSPEKLKKKGYEYLRLLKLKRGAGLVNMSDTCAVVVCLNLAADKLGCSFDRVTAIKVAGVNNKLYTNFYHTVEKVLGLDKPVRIEELCVKLECPEVSQLAQRLVDRYVHDEGKANGPAIDLSHPMYACAAILAACRHKKVRVKKEQLIQNCRVKVKDLEKLAAQLAVLAEQSDKLPSRKRRHHLIDMVEQMVKESQKTSVDMGEEDDKAVEPQESLEQWKKRILAKAGGT